VQQQVSPRAMHGQILGMAAIQRLTSGEQAASSDNDQKRTSSMFCIFPF
jgi:hypothetical protein